MMISRRPNKWQSTENAPGPRKPVAAAIMTIKKVASLESDKIGAVAGNQENAMPTLTMPTRKPAIGVRSPIRSKVPAVTASNPTPHAPSVRASESARETPP